MFRQQFFIKKAALLSIKTVRSSMINYFCSSKYSTQIRAASSTILTQGLFL
jgi:hypothetical protein